ncbi:MAG: 7-carboxy-7-deazaguanine synthase QueE [Sphingobacteriales bacterium]|jgi:organic radical activating enzyme|nr:7-carboxy-7-deazaguanine synthase QueE [Sphingobacteriales bacterium]
MKNVITTNPAAKPAIISLPLMEHFYTLQGEGYHQGRAAYFIRLGGCDVGCVWCDVKESWDAEVHPKVSIDEMVDLAKLAFPPNNHNMVVVTGGEPLMHNLDRLTLALKNEGIATHIETSGAHPMSGSWDWVCLSPKKFKAPLPEIMMQADELKVVIFHPSDFDWAESHAALVRPDCKLYLQPEWDKSAIMTPQIISYIKAHPQWELSLQLHKYINVP